jgi:polysaccharide biosynthesis transport protein
MENTRNNTANAGSIGLEGFEYYGLQDYGRMLWRRRWTIVSVTLALALLTAVVAYFIPNVYSASTVILVDPRKVPDSLVSSTALSAADRLSSLREQVLSNTSLSQIIDELGLYPDMKKHAPQEEVIAQMLKDTTVEIIATTSGQHGLGAFRITYRSKNPQSAAQVANRLASLFIVQNIKEREQQVQGTAEFMDRELAEAKKDLDEKDSKVQQVKTKYMEELPESEAAHSRALSSLELDMRADMDALNRGQQQKTLLQSMLASTPTVVNLDEANPQTSSLESQLAAIQGERDQLMSHYGPEYPDVRKKTSEIQDLEKKIKEMKSAGKSTDAPRSRNPVLEAQIGAIDAEMQKTNDHLKQLKEQVAYHQGKLSRAPALDQELATVQAAAESARERYKHLEERKFAADMSSDMETRQKAERFVVLEPALPPEKPVLPNRPLINLLGFLGGLLVAVATTFVLEVMDTTVKTPLEVTEKLPVPIFGEIPWLPTEAGLRREHMRSLLAAAANSVLALLFVAVVYMTM